MQYSENGNYDVLKDGKIVGRIVSGIFFSVRNGRAFNFNRPDGGVQGDCFFYRGTPVAKLVEGQLIGEDGTVLKLEPLRHNLASTRNKQPA